MGVYISCFWVPFVSPDVEASILVPCLSAHRGPITCATVSSAGLQSRRPGKWAMGMWGFLLFVDGVGPVKGDLGIEGLLPSGFRLAPRAWR